MTVLTSESSLLSTEVRLPRVNLLPPEIAEAKRARRIQLGLGAAVAASAVTVVGLYVLAGHGVSAAKEDLAAAQSERSQLQTQTLQYSGVTATIAAASAAQAQLATAMADEVRYSQLLSDLSLAIPSTVWLKSLAFAPAAPGAPGGTPTAAGAAPTAVSPAAPARVGTLTVSGVGFSHEDVALWLEAIARLDKTYANPYFSNSTEALLGTRPTVNFSGTADLMSTAQSGRYTTAARG